MPGGIGFGDDALNSARNRQNMIMQQQVNNRELEEKKKEKEASRVRAKKLSGMLGKLKSMLGKALNNAQQASINAAGNGMDSPGDTAKSGSAGDAVKGSK